MTTTTLPTRRHMLAGVPALAAATLPTSATALSGLPGGSADDPIFALIAEHREAIRGETAAYLLLADAEEKFQFEKSWSYRAGDKGPPEGCSDPPEWIAAQMQTLQACDRQNNAEFAVLTTPPTTLAGVVALLEHVGDDAILETASLCYRDDIKDAAADFLPMIAAALRKLLAV